MCTPVGTNQNAIDLNVTLENARGELIVEERSSPVGNSNSENTVSDSNVKGLEFRPWMLVEKKTSRRGKCETKKEILVKHANLAKSFRFLALSKERDLGVDSAQETRAFARKELGDKVAGKSREGFSRDFSTVDKSGIESGQKQAVDPNFLPLDADSNQGNFNSISQNNNEAEVLKKIKAHYNLVFDETEGFIVHILNNTLDPESMESMVELLSSQTFNEMPNAKFDGAGAKTDNNTGHES
ncbi:hypothetical protein J1N35_034888 [Gossypium stocksii]|uniref:Uncharacterized protein n=1 Tax=Gossypium stocksii TaxID=47602 RepID=A0A9D3USV9_9ROSI|nr:hypothetical protein J1N35_034888 [Gossypium stocksii]